MKNLEEKNMVMFLDIVHIERILHVKNFYRVSQMGRVFLQRCFSHDGSFLEPRVHGPDVGDLRIVSTTLKITPSGK